MMLLLEDVTFTCCSYTGEEIRKFNNSLIFVNNFFCLLFIILIYYSRNDSLMFRSQQTLFPKKTSNLLDLTEAEILIYYSLTITINLPDKNSAAKLMTDQLMNENDIVMSTIDSKLAARKLQVNKQSFSLILFKYVLIVIIIGRICSNDSWNRI